MSLSIGHYDLHDFIVVLISIDIQIDVLDSMIIVCSLSHYDFPEVPMCNGGFASVWKNYVNTATILDALNHSRRLEDDVREIDYQLHLTDKHRLAISNAATAAKAFFASFSLSKKTGDQKLKEEALSAITAMGASMADAEKKEIGFP